MRTRRITARSVVLLTSLVLLMGGGEARAQQRPGIHPFVNIPEGCSLSAPPELESLYSFTRMQILAVWMAGRGEQANLDVLASKEDLPMNQMAEMIAGLRQEHIEDACAAFVVSPYTQSQNVNAATVAKILTSAYQQLGDMADQMLGIILQGTRSSDPRFVQDQLLQWKNRRQEILGNMTEALNVSLSMLVDDTRKDAEGKPDHLILTRAQRDALLKDLTTKFPSLAKADKTRHSGDFLEQAILIQTFLTGTYKPADSY